MMYVKVGHYKKEHKFYQVRQHWSSGARFVFTLSVVVAETVCLFGYFFWLIEPSMFHRNYFASMPEFSAGTLYVPKVQVLVWCGEYGRQLTVWTLQHFGQTR